MVYLLNSAVIAAGVYGTYRYAPATWRDIRDVVRAGGVVSRIGYRQTAAVIERHTGWRPPLSREPTPMAVGDVAYVVRLRYRLADPAQKGAPVDDDWELGRLERLG